MGWLIWAGMIPWLLIQLPPGFPLVTWDHGDGVVYVTWSYLVCGVVLFWVWPVVFGATRLRGWLVTVGRAVAAGRRMLWAAMRRNPLFFVSWVLLLVAWQVASYIVPTGVLEHPLVPGWDYVFGEPLMRVSRFWTVQMVDIGWAAFNFEGLAPLPILRGEGTWPAVFLAIAYHSVATLSRLFGGVVVGMTMGVLTGLALPYWPRARKTAWAPLNFLRMIPLLVAAPWLGLVVGSTFLGITAYIAFGVWTILVVATMNAVANVPDRYIESGRTLGASRLHTYYRVIVPGSLPELRTALLLALGGSWSMAIAAEFLGFSAGLGYLADAAVQETNTALLLIVTAIVASYSLATFLLLNQGFKKMINWRLQRPVGKMDMRKMAGAVRKA